MSSEPETVAPTEEKKEEQTSVEEKETKEEEEKKEEVKSEEKKEEVKPEEKEEVTPEEEKEVTPEEKPHDSPIQVLICGYTGATGKELTDILIKDDRIAKIVAIGRRQVADMPEKVVQLVAPEIYNLDELSKTSPEITEGKGKYAAAFCCLGTTHGDAGSNEAFRKIDLDGVVAFANVAKSLEIPVLCLVSSTGASSSSWFNYPKTKGLAEEALIALQFPKLAIFRPGLLDRGAVSRSNEKFAKIFVSGMPVKTLAAVMFEIAMDPEKFQKDSAVGIYYNKEIYEIAKAKAAEEEEKKGKEEK